MNTRKHMYGERANNLTNLFSNIGLSVSLDILWIRLLQESSTDVSIYNIQKTFQQFKSM